MKNFWQNNDSDQNFNEKSSSGSFESYLQPEGKEAPTFYLVQGMGELELKAINAQDQISALTFDKQGKYLTIGDNGGRVIVFIFNEDGNKETMDSHGRIFPNLTYLTEFQSFETEFNFQKSIEIPEKLTAIEWINYDYQGSQPQLITANDKVIKLFQIRVDKILTENAQNAQQTDQQDVVQTSAVDLFDQSNQIVFPKKKINHFDYGVRLRATYANGHQFHIHSVSQSRDGECFISADDITINLWNVEDTYQSYNIVNLSPPKIEDLQEVITHVEFHPNDSQRFLYTSSKGYFMMCDLRANTHQKDFCSKFVTADEQGLKNQFSEIINSVTCATFSNSGERFQVISRDYLFIKLWDIRKPGIEAVQTFKICDYLENNLQSLYDNDCIFDRFNVSCSSTNHYLSTGCYNDSFQIIDIPQQKSLTLKANANQRRYEQNEIVREYENNGRIFDCSIWNQDTPVDFSKKVSHTCWHPKIECAAVTSLNCIYLFSK